MDEWFELFHRQSDTFLNPTKNSLFVLKNHSNTIRHQSTIASKPYSIFFQVVTQLLQRDTGGGEIP